MTIELNQYSLIEQTFASGGVNLKSAVTALQDNETPYCRNVTFGSIYGVESRQGFSKKIQTPTGATITGIYQLQRSNNTEFNIFASGADIYLRTSYTAYTSIIAGRTPGAFYDFSTLNDYAFIVNGVDPNLKYDGTNVYALGVPAPVAAPAVAVGAAGVLTGAYQYAYTWENLDGEESNPSAISAVVNPAAQQVNLTGITVAPAPAIGVQQIVARRIYRTEAGGATLFFVARIADNVTTIYTDNLPDDQLGIELEFDNDIPPILSIIETHKDRLFGVDPLFPSNLLFSKLYRHDQWPILFSIPVGLDDGDVITAVVSFFDQLVIFKRKSIYVLSGDNELNFVLQKAQTDSRIGALNNRVPAVIGNRIYFLSERGVYSFDGLRIQYESVKIEPFFDVERPFSQITFNWAFENIALGINYKNAAKNWYVLCVPTGSVAQNDFIWVLDTVINAWTPFTGILASYMAVIEENNRPRLWSGDYQGFLWLQDDTNNDGYVHTASFSTSNTNGVNTLQDDTQAEIISLATALGANTLTDTTLLGVVINQYAGDQIYINTGAGAGQVRTIVSNTASPVTFTVSAPWGVVPAPGDQYIVGGFGVGDLQGVRVKIVDGLGQGQIRTISTNTPTVFTVTSNWSVIPNTTSRYSIGFIEKQWNTKWINYGDPDRWKRLVFEHINTSRENQILSVLELTTYFDFNTGASFQNNVSLAGADSLWDVALWDIAFWDNVAFVVTRIRAEGGHIHRYVQLQFYNDVGNEPFIVNSLGFQWQLKGYR